MGKEINGVWVDFDVSGNDQLGSNSDNGAGVCDDPVFNIGLRAGAQCVFFRIYDGGSNDGDGFKDGTIIDPSGALVPGSPNTPPSFTDGCSLTGGSVELRERAGWRDL